MFKKIAAIFTVLIFVFTLIPTSIITKAYAYSNEAYFKDIKVGLKSMEAESLIVSLNGSYLVNGKEYPLGTVLNLKAVNDKINMNGYDYTEISVIPVNREGSNLTIQGSTYKFKYFGNFTFKVINPDKVFPINEIDIETYLKGVVGYEMAEYYPIEALKAQAVAARNYALTTLTWGGTKDYNIDDTHSYQTYGGFNENLKNVIKSVEDTKGTVLLYDDRLVETLYGASNGGYSEDSVNVWGNQVPYLKAKQDSFDSYLWPNGDVVLTNAQIESTLKSKKYLTLTDKFIKIDLESITKYPSGRISNITVVYQDSLGTVKTKSFNNDRARTFLSLPSSMYNVTFDGVDKYTFSGQGYGHGLGMSQIGAMNRGKSGQTYEEILKFYYDNSYPFSFITRASDSYNSIKDVNIAAERKETLVGQDVKFTSSASGGSGSLNYKFVIKKGDYIVFTRDYSNASDLSYAFQEAGDYTVNLYIQDSLQKEGSSTVNVKVYSKPVLDSYTASASSTSVGQGVSFNAEVSGGSGQYLYKYVVLKNWNWVMDRPYSEDKAFIYTPITDGTYQVYVYIKDKISTTDNYDAGYIFRSFTAANGVSISNITAAGNFYEMQTININVKAAGGSSQGLIYRYETSKNGVLLETKNWSADSYYNVKPWTEGTYDLRVYVKDKSSTSQYDAVKDFKLNILDTPINISKLPLSWGARGTEVVSIQNALNTLGYNAGYADGVYGSKTYNAVITFQKNNKLSQTGSVDSATLKVINESLIQKSGVKTLTF